MTYGQELRGTNDQGRAMIVFSADEGRASA
jgi:hypothetical protein